MNEAADSVPDGKHNPWCHKQMLTAPAETAMERANRHLVDPDLSPIEKSALWFHEMTGAQGLEFVAFSNARLDTPVVLSHEVALMPCFVPESEMAGHNINDPLVQLTLKMSARARFVYDGWGPIQDWDAAAVRAAVEAIHESLSLFALMGRSWFEWEPKYRGARMARRFPSAQKGWR
jgi:hypothetical protein